MAKGRETIEHLIAKALNGTDALENLVLCHRGCNVHLKDRPLEQKLKIQAKWHHNAA
jgi:5-methylcytosine-specific restriction endonuclease McrA